MKPVFADTYYFAALINPDDAGSTRVQALSEREAVRVVTSEWVLLELADGLSNSNRRSAFGELIDVLRGDSATLIVSATSADFRLATALYKKRPDKHWSLTDCTSFIIMKRLRLRDALTADRHFEQAGFRAVLK